MARAAALAMLVTWTALFASDRTAHADDVVVVERSEEAEVAPAPDITPPRILVGPNCCMPRSGYRARTHFVPEMLRSVEAL
jgi:hypothetical protein